MDDTKHPNPTGRVLLTTFAEWTPPPFGTFPIINPRNSEITTLSRPSNDFGDFAATFQYANLVVPGSVIAYTAIPEGSTSSEIDPLLLLEPTQYRALLVQMRSQQIVLTEPSSRFWPSSKVHWVRVMKLAYDCSSYNVELRIRPMYSLLTETKHPATFYLHATKHIQKGEELVLWFSPEILGKLNIAGLLPENIQGGGRYVCEICSARFEMPNPLKLHRRLDCEKRPIVALWQDLVFGLPNLRASDIRLRLASHPENQLLPHKLVTRPSAFRPYARSVSSNEEESPSTSLASGPVNLLQQAGIPGMDPQMVQEEMETLVSTLGKSKQGYICLFCGKRYTRKYGLKIHLRTHTGHKPLKCKYCERTFGDPSNLNKHVRLHYGGITPYKCNICGKMLVRRRDLERHLKSRHDVNPDQNVLQKTPISPNDSVLDEEIKIMPVTADKVLCVQRC